MLCPALCLGPGATAVSAQKDSSRLSQIQRIDSVVVLGSRRPEKIIPAQVLDGAELQRLSVHSVADAIRYFSGVQIKDYGGIGGLKTINVRSMGTQHVGVFYDGVQITGRHVVDELTIGQRSYNEAFGVTDPLAGTESPSGPASAPPPTLADQERAALEQALAYAGGNRALAARLLGRYRTALYQKLERLRRA